MFITILFFNAVYVVAYLYFMQLFFFKGISFTVMEGIFPYLSILAVSVCLFLCIKTIRCPILFVWLYVVGVL